MTDEHPFPRLEDIPAEHRLEPLSADTWLAGGELLTWAGPSETAFGAICVGTPAGLERPAIGRYPLHDEAAALDALRAAARAYDRGRGAWPTMPVAARIERVQDFALRMKSQREAVVRLMMWEIGKTLADARREFDRTVEYIDDTIDALKDLDRQCSRFVVSQGVIGQVRRAPLGVALCMGPSNYPLNETYTTLIPALVMGNTAVTKTPRPGTLLHAPLVGALRDAFPPGVVNTVNGTGRAVAPPLMASGAIDVLAFIGSAPAADALKRAHPAPHRLRSVLGLEAKNPAIVLPDADLDLAVRECVLGALSYNGQRCTALKILFVHASILDAFLDRFVRAVDGLRVGMPWDEGVAITPLPDLAQVRKQVDLIEDAVSRGARVVNRGGGEHCQTLLLPAVLHPVGPGMRVYDEEQWGPVVPIVAFGDVETPGRYVLDSKYGQQVSVFGNDPQAIGRLIDPLVNQVCRVNLNSQCQRGPDVFPFTGRKDSAEGTLSVSDALRVFSIRTLVAAKEHPANRALVTRIVRERTSTFLNTDFIL
jgi:glyceraldehyde-3-phosphate dehydrogenase (NADP+)